MEGASNVFDRWTPFFFLDRGVDGSELVGFNDALVGGAEVVVAAFVDPHLKGHGSPSAVAAYR